MHNKNDDNDSNIAKLPKAGGEYPRPLLINQAITVAM